MDREQEEMQFLGVFGIFAESSKIIYKWRKIFTEIALALVLPLSFIFLAHLEISHILSHKLWHTRFEQRHTRTGSARYQKLSDLISSETAALWCFRAAYFFFVLIFSLLSTAAVVYTVASVYTARELSFKKVMKIVPKVWKRLMLTFLCIVLALFVYNIAAGVVIFLGLTIGVNDTLKVTFLIIVLIIYAVGFVYMSIIWHLASVVTVLEESYGFKAMIKSKGLIKGNTWTAATIFFLLNLIFLGVNVFFKSSVVYHDRSLGIIPRIGYGVLCLSLLVGFILFGLVIQTILYFVCKSYNHENIDKSELSDHLEVIYLGEYVPLKSNVQLEEFRV